MGSRFQCLSCGKEVKVRFLKVGEIAKCKSCGTDCKVPWTAEHFSSDAERQLPADVKRVNFSSEISLLVSPKGIREFDSEDAQMIEEQLADGKTEEEITQMLVINGIANDEASDFVQGIVDSRSEKETEPSADAYKRKMISGALWAIGGIAVTTITYQAAQDGGVYVVTWGAIAFGAWDFLSGMVGYLSCNEAHEAEVDVSYTN